MRPKSIWRGSPNFTPQDPGRTIKYVIIHATATDSKESPLDWLCNKFSKVSAHYLIDPLGMLYYLVDEQNRAWHAGTSSWRGEMFLNKTTVGIELVNPNDGKTPYPQPQLEICADLCAAIAKDHNLAASDVIGHADIAPGRKFDPAGFDWVKFRGMLIARGLGA